ncbi:MAG TPA: hypothetical protein VF228_26460 [Iamia sp.]
MTVRLRGPRAAAAWAVEAVATAPAGLRTLVPGAPVPAALREDVLVAVARAQGAAGVAWIHGEWRAFAGSTPDGDVRLALAAHAERGARAGHPVPPDELTDVLPPAAVRGVRAVVARARLESEVEARTRRVLAAARRGRPSRDLVVDLPLAAVGLAAAAPAAGVGLALGALARLAPPVPVVEGAGDADVGLLGALAAEAVPVLLGNAAVRAAVLGSPLVIAVGLRSGGRAATVRVGRGRAQVVDGLTPDALVVLQGDVEPLVRLATGVLLREAHDVHARR